MKTIYRTKLTTDFTVLPNCLLRDKSLSFKARGIIAMVLSNREEWVVHQCWLQDQGLEGREAIASGMHELERSGYAVYQTMRNDSGRIEAGVWTFYDIPVDETERSTRTGKGGLPCDGKPDHGKLSHGTTTHGNPAAKKEHSQKDDLPKRREAPKQKGEKNHAPRGAATHPLVSPPAGVVSSPSAARSKTKLFIAEWKSWYSRYYQQDQIVDSNQEKKVRTFFETNPEATPREIIAIALNAWRQAKVAKEDGTEQHFFYSVNHSKLPGNLLNNYSGLVEEIEWKHEERRIQRQYNCAEQYIQEHNAGLNEEA